MACVVIICDFDANLMEECASGSLFLMIIWRRDVSESLLL